MHEFIINLQRMGYGNCSLCVCVSVCLSVTTKSAAYLVFFFSRRPHTKQNKNGPETTIVELDA